MNSLLALAIEADKPKKPVCHMAETAQDLQTAVANIGQSLYSLKDDVKAAKAAAEQATIAAVEATKAANKPAKVPKQTKQDYVMDVVRDDEGQIMRIDVRAV